MRVTVGSYWKWEAKESRHLWEQVSLSWWLYPQSFSPTAQLSPGVLSALCGFYSPGSLACI